MNHLTCAGDEKMEGGGAGFPAAGCKYEVISAINVLRVETGKTFNIFVSKRKSSFHLVFFVTFSLCI
jgi:hypothetical protein